MLILLISSLTVQAQGPPSFVGTDVAHDDGIYPGYYWGAAGIVEGLISLYNSSYVNSNQKEKISNLISIALEGIWASRTTNEMEEKIPSWTKFADGGDIYPGKKYGTAGIVPVLLKAYEIFENPIYLEWANESIYEVYAQADHFDQIHWPYSYFFTRGAIGNYITDLSFGSFGIIDASLDLFEFTEDPQLLEYIQSAVDWVYAISYNETVNGVDGKIIPWYSTQERINNTYTSFAQGNTGPISVLHRFYQITNNQTLSNWAEFLTSWIISQQYEEGFWSEAYQPVETNPGTEFETGVSGILYALNNINKWSNNSDITNSIDNGVDWLYAQFIDNSTAQIFKYYENQNYAKYSLYQGMTGIVRTLRILGETGSILTKSYNWLINEGLYEYNENFTSLLGMYPSSLNQNYVDHSLTYGLTGLIVELVNADVHGLVNLESEIVDLFLDTLDFYQLDNGLWKRQVNVDNSFFNRYMTEILIFSALVMILVIALVIRRNRLEKDVKDKEM